MRSFGKALGRLLLALSAVVAALWLFGPKEAVDINIDFDAGLTPGGVDTHFAAAEAKFDDISLGTEKQIV